MKIEITIEYGRWLVNGKPYSELVGVEREFFNEFLRSERLLTEA